MSKSVSPLLWIGLTGCLVFGSSLVSDVYRAYWGDRSIWWTPRHLSLTLDESRGAFELFVADRLLQEHLAKGTLQGLDTDGRAYPIAPEAVEVRLNNWHEVQAGILGGTLLSGFGLGVSLTLLIVGWVLKRGPGAA